MIYLNINGLTWSFDVDGDTPLLWFYATRSA